MKLRIEKDADLVCRTLAGWMSVYIHRVLERKKTFSLVLSGGSTPKKLYYLLASSPFREKIEWSRLLFFWGDERCVPFTDERNNARMAWDHLLSKVAVKKDQVFMMDTDLEPEQSAAAYEKMLREKFEEEDHTFDMVLLGLGDNAHTLSLFPGQEVVNERSAWVRSLFLKEQDMYRITLTPGVVNRAATIAFLVTGADKACAVQQVIENEKDVMKYPAQAIRPEQGELYWWLDEEAASRLH